MVKQIFKESIKMVVLEVKWENVRKKEQYEVSIEFWAKLLDKVEEAEMCNRIAVDPNRIVLHNTDEMIDFFKEHCSNMSLVAKFSEKTSYDKLVLVERILVNNNYNAPIHKIKDGYAYLYKKGSDWSSLGGQKWSSTETYPVRISDRALLRLGIVSENMVTAKEKFKHNKGKIAFAYVSVLAETNEFIVQHLFKDVFEWNNWKDNLISTDLLYKGV